MMDLIRRNPKWSVFFGGVTTVLLFMLSALSTFTLLERDQAYEKALAQTEQEAHQQTPPPVPPEAGSGGTGVPVADIAVDLDSEWIDQAASRTKIPPRVLRSYVAAASWSTGHNRQCNLAWNTLAGIGAIETNHGRHGGAHVGEDGNLVGVIVGTQLDGIDTAKIPDTDNGRLDGDAEFDRAVGPMQFIPSTWKAFAVDSNGAGKKDPNNIDDATATAADYLCASGRDLSDQEQWVEAILSYNPSDEYVRQVTEQATSIAKAVEEPAEDSADKPSHAPPSPSESS